MAMTATQRSAAAKKAHETMRLRKLNPPRPRPVFKPRPQEPIQMPKKVTEATAQEMQMRTVVMALTLEAIGNRRKVNTSKIEAQGTDKNWLNVTKKLLECDELEEITSLYSEVRRYVEDHALPSIIKRGVYLLPIEFIESMEEKLTAFQARLASPVSRMCARLGTLKEEARRRLGPNYNGEDYWSAEELRGAFRLTWRFLYVDSAKNLDRVSQEIADKERERAETAWQETRETIQLLLRVNLKEMVDHLVDKLTPDQDGRTKIFRDSSIEKMSAFLSTFDARNITNDAQMKVLVDKAKSLIAGTDPEGLRTQEEMRNYVRHGFETIKTLLDPMIAKRPVRSIILPNRNAED